MSYEADNNTGRTPATGGLQTSIAGAANEAYQRAPDMGISSTVKSAYEKAPNMGLQSGLRGVTGQSDTQNSAENEETDANGSAPNNEQRRGEGSVAKYDITKQRGPSSQERMNKSQKEIGTEYGIPTAAGVGTTVSPDQSNLKARDQESANNSSNGPRKAAVPEDYLPEPCPTENAGTGRVDEVQNNLDNTKGISVGNQTNHAQETPNASSDSQQSPQKRHSDGFGSKVKNQVRGEIKIIKGSVTKNEDKVNEGISIKRGE